MRIIGNNDGDLKGSKRNKKQRENATGKSTAQIAAHNAKVNSGDFTANDHGLPAGGHVGTVLQGAGKSESGAKFRRAVRGKKSGRGFASKRAED